MLGDQMSDAQHDVEITAEMIEAGIAEFLKYDNRFEEVDGVVCRIWRAMFLAMRPSPPIQEFLYR